jgi:putative lipoic acid-binding regulatory protein
MSDLPPPKIEFPCPDYAIRVMGEASEHFRAYVVEVFERHAPDFDRDALKIRPSSSGRYESVKVVITATGVEQLQAIFIDLKKHPAVQMVL